MRKTVAHPAAVVAAKSGSTPMLPGVVRNYASAGDSSPARGSPRCRPAPRRFPFTPSGPTRTLPLTNTQMAGTPTDHNPEDFRGLDDLLTVVAVTPAGR